MMRNVHFGWLIALVSSCTQAAEPAGPVQQLVNAAAAEANVPADLVLAIAAEERGLELPALRVASPDEQVPAAGMLELRRGKLDTLALGAQLMSTDELALRGDTALGTRAGARVLAYLGAQTGADDRLWTWRAALEQLSGMDDLSAQNYASRIFGLLRTGGDFTARGGERIHLAAHPEILAGETIENTARVLAADPEFPGAIWFPTSCTNKCTVGRPLGNAAVNKIVIHDTEGGWDASVATLQYDSGKSVHYIIDADGSRVGQFRTEGDTTWHAGNYYFNETSIGIEHVGRAADPAGYSTGLYAKSVELVKSIRSRWNVPLDRAHIIGHYQIPNGNAISESSAACSAGLDACETSSNYGGAGNHTDPGYNWQWCQYMESLGGTCACNDAWDNWNCTTDKTEAWRCNNGTLEEQHCTGPAACTVMPVGTPDVCDTSGANPGDGSGSDSGSGSGSGSGSDDGTGGGGSDGGGSSPSDPGGCSATGGGSPLALFAALGAVLLGRRRRRA